MGFVSHAEANKNQQLWSVFTDIFQVPWISDVELGRADSVLISIVAKIPFHQSKSVSLNHN